MFTNNAKHYIDYIFSGKVNIDNHDVVPYCTLPTYNKIESKIQSVMGYPIFTTMARFPSKDPTTTTIYTSSIGYHYGVVFGDGNGIPSASDSKLFGQRLTSITSSNTTVHTKVEYDNELMKTYYTGIYTISNNTTSDITVNEIGLLCECLANYGSGNDKQTAAVLFEHSVLDAPVTIPVNSVGQITYTICIDDPTFN